MSKSEAGTVKETAICRWRDCGKRYEREVMVIDGHRVPTSIPKCPECLERDEQERQAEIEAERIRQASRRLEIPEEDHESRILAGMEWAGVNVRKHGLCHLAADGTPGSFDCSKGGTTLPLEAAQEFAADVVAAGKWGAVRSLYLTGPTGVGKSHLAAGIVRHVVSQGIESVRWEPSDRLIIEIQDTYGTGQTGAILERLESCRLLVLDDFGSEKPTDDALRILFSILNRREGHATLITSNYAPDQLSGRWKENDMWARVCSRLGGQNYRLVRLKGDDERFRKQETTEEAIDRMGAEAVRRKAVG